MKLFLNYFGRFAMIISLVPLIIGMIFSQLQIISIGDPQFFPIIPVSIVTFLIGFCMSFTIDIIETIESFKKTGGFINDG